MTLAKELFNQLKDLVDVISLKQELEYYFENASEEQSIYRTLFDLAILFGKSGYLDFKIVILESLYEIKQEAKVAFVLAQQYYDLEALDTSEFWLNELQKFEENDRTLMLKAKILQLRGETTLARSLFEQVIKEYPRVKEAYYDAGELSFELGDLKKATQYFKVILDYFPESQFVRDSSVKLLEIQLNREVIDVSQLLQLIDKINQFEFGDSEIYYKIAKALYHVKQFPEALAYAKMGWEIDRELIDLAILQLQIGVELDDDVLAKEMIQWLEINLPPYDEAIGDVAIIANQYHLMSSIFSSRLKDYLLLLDNQEKILELLPIVTDYLIQHHAADELLDFLDILAEEMESPAYLSYGYAKAYALKGNYNEAEAYYQDSLDLAINSELLVYELVLLYLKENKVDKARTLIEQYSGTIYDTIEVQEIRTRLEGV